MTLDPHMWRLGMTSFLLSLCESQTGLNQQPRYVLLLYSKMSACSSTHRGHIASDDALLRRIKVLLSQNKPPLPAKKDYLQSILCDSQSTLSKLNTQISLAQETLASLKR
ncbi:uncharacterized protein EV420DRAFT_1481606 [Desarmillaria tabescens]|uniref:Uncharacterized protein n=1 Tax=Armillaria tabescens TaxID=1929756 RepID=A0AA39K6C7_ARMTA|nr:uncharacterized protein EV420DRAFT_1481606 [Desarmillaria tabescens]KAK0454166.1 hypothetical protein EV420DRAFT_1481606 [Desarmillaria tabescens]